MDRFDRYWIGIALGLCLPVLVAWLYISRYHLGITFRLFDLQIMGSVLSRIIQVSLFPDLALVFVFYTTDTWRLSKGVLMGALPYLIASIVLII